MTNDELRALADALSSGTHHVESPELHEAMMRAADYLRAQADAQPVGILTVSRFRGHLENYSFDYTGELPEGGHPLYTRPAPAAPQAEPIDPHMIVAEDRFPDEQAEPKRELTADERDMMDSALRASVKLVARGVAESKREPLTMEQINALPEAQGVWSYADSRRVVKVIRAVERAHGIGGSDAE